MVIKGLTDRGRVPTLPYIGKLRKGSEATGGIGKDLTYFRFTSDRPDVERAFRSAYGDAPRSIEVVLPYATPDENLEVWQEAYTAGGFQHRCDGETMVLWRDEKGIIRHDPKPCPFAGKPRTQNSCKPVARLTVILPKLIEAGYVGYVTVESHSVNDIINLKDSLDATYQSAAAHGADLRGILYTLYRAPVNISTPGTDGKRVRREKWLLFIVPATEWVLGMQRLARQSQAEILGGEVKLLPSETVDVETGEVLTMPEPEPELEEDNDDAYAELVEVGPDEVPWQKDDVSLAVLDSVARDLGLSDEAVSAALSLEKGQSLGDFEGTWDEAADLLEKYAIVLWAQRELGLTGKQILGALEVKRVRDYKGSYDEMRAVLQAAAARVAHAAPAEQEAV